MKGVKIRLSRTLVMVFGGLLLIGGSGAAALYIGADTLLGPSYEEINGLECTTSQLVKIKRENYFWVRKYVFTEGGSGPARLKTALRVAQTVQAAEHADLIQVTVLDKTGPNQRAAMRGRTIGAQVVYIPDAAKAPDPSDPKFSAFYVEGAPASNGEFYGLRIDVPLEDVEHMVAALTDHADCASPISNEPAADGHGAASDKKGAKGSGHGEPTDHGSGHGEPTAHDSGHGEEKTEPSAEKAAPEAGGHDAKPAAEGAEGAGESKGLLSSVTDMIFGKSTEAAAAAPPGADGKEAVAENVVTDHNAPSTEHTAVTEQPGFFGRLKGMILGSADTNVVVGQGEQRPSAPSSGARQEHGEAAPHDGIDPMKVAAPVDAPPPAQAETAPHAPATPNAPSH